MKYLKQSCISMCNFTHRSCSLGLLHCRKNARQSLLSESIPTLFTLRTSAMMFHLNPWKRKLLLKAVFRFRTSWISYLKVVSLQSLKSTLLLFPAASSLPVKVTELINFLELSVYAYIQCNEQKVIKFKVIQLNYYYYNILLRFPRRIQ